jgi:hypothetical protein
MIDVAQDTQYANDLDIFVPVKEPQVLDNLDLTTPLDTWLQSWIGYAGHGRYAQVHRNSPTGPVGVYQVAFSTYKSKRVGGGTACQGLGLDISLRDHRQNLVGSQL